MEEIIVTKEWKEQLLEKIKGAEEFAEEIFEIYQEVFEELT